jgi:hypothetical protein
VKWEVDMERWTEGGQPKECYEAARRVLDQSVTGRRTQERSGLDDWRAEVDVVQHREDGILADHKGTIAL